MVNYGGGKDIKATGLNEIAQGITGTLSELKELGIDSMAGVGQGFSNLELSGRNCFGWLVSCGDVV